MNDIGRLGTGSSARVPRAERPLARIRRSRMPGLWLGIAGVALCSILVAGCATKSRHEWLTIFFDGVPEPGAPPATAEDLWAETPEADALAPAPAVRTIARDETFIHDPFAEQDCSGCHKSAFSQQLFGEMTEVCFSCHDDFLSEAKVPHDPASGGECLVCHEPHIAELPALLRMPVPTVCYECHDSVTEAEFQHDPAAEGECMTCHDPHASDHAALARLPGAELCYDCHDTVTEAEFQHDPAAEGECTTCHDPHASDHAAYLVLDGQALCYDCHDEDDVTSGEAHQDMGTAPCTECHDPHQGDDEFFLKGDRAQSVGTTLLPGAA